jgi:hypothetical protein
VKKFPIIHSKIVDRRSSTGPVKKNIPTTLAAELAPPQPINTIAKVVSVRTNPINPKALGFAKVLLSFRSSTLDMEWSFSMISGESVKRPMERVLSRHGASDPMAGSISFLDIFWHTTVWKFGKVALEI